MTTESPAVEVQAPAQSTFESEFHHCYTTDYAPMVRFFTFRHHLSDESAEDIVQTAWTRAWECRDQFSGRSSVRTWVTTIATHALYDHYRRRSKRILDDYVPLADAREPSYTESIDDRMIAAELFPQVWITRRDREIGKCFLEGLTPEEIGIMTNLEPGSIRTIIYRNIRNYRNRNRVK